jgi:hypothetical protein
MAKANIGIMEKDQLIKQLDSLKSVEQRQKKRLT